MAQRISRARQSIKSSGVGFIMPTDAERAERLTAVLHVLYLIFNEGYTSSVGPDLARTDLSNEAIRLTRQIGLQVFETLCLSILAEIDAYRGETETARSVSAIADGGVSAG